MKKIIIWSSFIFTIGCANVVTQPTSLPSNTNKEVVNNVPLNPITPEATHSIIAMHVINASNGKPIYNAEVSANGKYFGNTSPTGDFSIDLDYSVVYDFTIYHGEYVPSHEKHIFTKDNNSFTSMLTSIR